jgi:hypothetical protein
MATCPTCGGPIEVETSAEALLRLLTEGRPHRHVYRPANGTGWYVTHSGKRFSAEAVHGLVRAGKIHSVYSDCPDDAYHVGKTLDVKATTEERRNHRQRKDAPKIYTDGTRAFD